MLLRLVKYASLKCLYLGFVPFLWFLDVFGGQVLILQTDVPQSRCQVRLSYIHVHLHMLLLMDLILQLQHFLQQIQQSQFVLLAQEVFFNSYFVCFCAISLKDLKKLLKLNPADVALEQINKYFKLFGPVFLKVPFSSRAAHVQCFCSRPI